ncbi:MAG TPA: helix-turn-helix domain-containing protein, partial [Aldersonia sp.]
DEFETAGYQTTTIAAVARRAGVSAETVYKAFGNKPTLAKAVFDFVIAGDDEPVPIAARAEAAATQAEPDVRRKIAMYAHGMAARQVRSARVQIAIRDGRTGDPEIDRIWQTLLDERLTGMTMLGRHLLDTGQLRSGIELDEVRDVLWTYIAVELYELLVLERGWSVHRYADWIARAITAALC